MSGTSKRAAIRSAMVSFAIGLLYSTSANATDYAYMATGSYSPPQPPFEFGVVDLSTGAFVSCGTMAVQLAGLGVAPDHNLYSGEFGGSNFYSVNLTNGALTLVGTSPINYFLQGSTLTSLYAVGLDSNLYTINYATGTVSLVGPLGISIDMIHTWGMSTNSKTLYMTKGATLFSINVATGRAHKIGGTGAASAFAAEVTEHGILYAGNYVPSVSIYTLDPKTGNSTFQATLTGMNGTLPVGIAPIEEQTISLRDICKTHQIP